MLTVFSKVLISIAALGTAGGAVAGILEVLKDKNYEKKEVLKSKQNSPDNKSEKISEITNNLLDNSSKTSSFNLDNEKTIPLGVSQDNIIEQKHDESVTTIKKIPIEMNLENLKKEQRKKWDKEVDNLRIKLESVYRDGENEEDRYSMGCILYKKDEKVSETADFIEGSRDDKEGEYDSCDFRTSWSLERFKEGEKGGLWIRGEEQEVRKLIKNNWDSYLLTSRFGSKDKQESNIYIDDKGWLTNLCVQEKENKNNWLEITCLKK